jgi:hypothetical protein
LGAAGGSAAHAANLRSPEIGIALVRDIPPMPRPADD